MHSVFFSVAGHAPRHVHLPGVGDRPGLRHHGPRQLRQHLGKFLSCTPTSYGLCLWNLCVRVVSVCGRLCVCVCVCGSLRVCRESTHVVEC